MRLDLVINVFVFNLIKKKQIYIDGDGKQFRPFISVNDILKIYEQIIKTKNMKSFTCNLVSFNATISDIALNICKILKVEKKMILFKGNVIDKKITKLAQKYLKNILVKILNFQILHQKLKL